MREFNFLVRRLLTASALRHLRGANLLSLRDCDTLFRAECLRWTSFVAIRSCASLSAWLLCVSIRALLLASLPDAFSLRLRLSPKVAPGFSYILSPNGWIFFVCLRSPPNHSPMSCRRCALSAFYFFFSSRFLFFLYHGQRRRNWSSVTAFFFPLGEESERVIPPHVFTFISSTLRTNCEPWHPFVPYLSSWPLSGG